MAVSQGVYRLLLRGYRNSTKWQDIFRCFQKVYKIYIYILRRYSIQYLFYIDMWHMDSKDGFVRWCLFCRRNQSHRSGCPNKWTLLCVGLVWNGPTRGLVWWWWRSAIPSTEEVIIYGKYIYIYIYTRVYTYFSTFGHCNGILRLKDGWLNICNSPSSLGQTRLWYCHARAGETYHLAKACGFQESREEYGVLSLGCWWMMDGDIPSS